MRGWLLIGYPVTLIIFIVFYEARKGTARPAHRIMPALFIAAGCPGGSLLVVLVLPGMFFGIAGPDTFARVMEICRR